MNLIYLKALQDVCDYLNVNVKIPRHPNDEALDVAVDSIKDKYQADIKTLRTALNGKQVMRRRDIKELMNYIDTFLIQEK